MNVWVTVDVKEVIEVVERYGYLKVLDDWYLVVELEREEDHQSLKAELIEVFQDQVDLEAVT